MREGMEKKEDIKITIAIPTYKRTNYLGQALTSAVLQDRTDLLYEVIVVNNDPADRMTELRKQFKNSNNVFFYNNETNLGMAGNMNRCLELARGEYVAFLHDDDVLMPNYLAEMEKVLSNGPVQCVVPQRELLIEKRQGFKVGRFILKKMIKQMLIMLTVPRYFHLNKLNEIRICDNVFSWSNCYGAPTCGTVFRKDVMLKYGLFLTEGIYNWDFLSYIALNRTEKIYFLREPLAAYRVTSGASLTGEAQEDTYDAYMYLREIGLKDPKTQSFIEKYDNEICYNTFSRLYGDGKEYVLSDRRGVVTERRSVIKYYWFQLRRIWYLANRNLDITRLPSINASLQLKKYRTVVSR